MTVEYSRKFSFLVGDSVVELYLEVTEMSGKQFLKYKDGEDVS